MSYLDLREDQPLLLLELQVLGGFAEGGDDGQAGLAGGHEQDDPVPLLSVQLLGGPVVVVVDEGAVVEADPGLDVVVHHAVAHWLSERPVHLH